MDIICAICTDPMVSTEGDIKVTHCGHMFHAKCMHEWLEKPASHPTCPECRTRCKPNAIVTVFLNMEKADVPQTPDAKAMREMDEHVMALATENSRLEDEIRKQELQLKSNKDSILYLNTIIKDLWKAIHLGTIKPDTIVFSNPLSTPDAKNFKLSDFSFPPPPFDTNTRLTSSAIAAKISSAVHQSAGAPSTSSTSSEAFQTSFSVPPNRPSTSFQTNSNHLSIPSIFAMPPPNIQPKSQPLQDITHTNIVNSRRASIAEAASSPKPKFKKCPKSFACRSKVIATMWCLDHKKCNDSCKMYLTDTLSIDTYNENGFQYCQTCVRESCQVCNRYLKGTCVQKDGEYYHEHCFPCTLCGTELNQFGDMLLKKSKQYCADCLVCMYCQTDLCGQLYSFEGQYPCCQSCTQNHY